MLIECLQKLIFEQVYKRCEAISFVDRVDAVVDILWARVSLALRDARFRMKNTLGVVLIRSLVSAICILGRLRSNSGVALI